MAGISDSQSSMHSALSPSYGISSDIFPGLFDWFFAHHVFDRWCRDRAWQLHCAGGPGSGKTTLAALVAKHLEAGAQERHLAVVSIFIQKDVVAYETSFLEDFLEIVYHKLGDSWACNEEDEEDFDEYQRQRYGNLEGCRASRRIHLIRKAVYSRLETLAKSARAFLVLDGIDLCSSTLYLLLDMELSVLQEKGLCILLTSRIAVFEQLEARCDHSNHGDAPDDDPIEEKDREVLDLFLLCRVCESVLCFNCRDAGRICENCDDNDALYEPYDHVTIPVNVCPPSELKQFIAWNLEREHGDLGLGSPHPRKPPLSVLGRSLRADRTSKSAEVLVDRIIDLAYGNVSLAKARLDLVHEAQSIVQIEARRDQLPANIVTMFDAGIKGVEAQSPTKRDLGLKAIAAASRDDQGISIPLMQRWLHQSISVQTRSGEDILEAARGFLLATPDDNPQKIRLFNTIFNYYVVERYSQVIHRADSQLRADTLRRKDSSYHEMQALSEPRVRFEPMNVSEEPTEITPYKLLRTTTTMDSIEEAPSQPFILRKGTRAWY
ncbi:hypothetical protein K505DRAFT_239126 [Melanomma pulvis-pyrius CBS 109.77]|uniref:Nephrocystin 3-like N-terminal domain-containing protein n=1 Tax=Melanomma pulvis-pyrius CBS 109.77 TaxID=1314802 RepID=A0A6A6XHT1_9PLEO|nr:hypothetical protein K505DRAFT_239126 [Melanomma pulvis-pyrius CBS 109.77]